MTKGDHQELRWLKVQKFKLLFECIRAFGYMGLGVKFLTLMGFIIVAYAGIPVYWLPLWVLSMSLLDSRLLHY